MIKLYILGGFYTLIGLLFVIHSIVCLTKTKVTMALLSKDDKIVSYGEVERFVGVYKYMDENNDIHTIKPFSPSEANLPEGVLIKYNPKKPDKACLANQWIKSLVGGFLCIFLGLSFILPNIL